MHEDNIRPNVVTYNTLVDVYGKTGQWEKAVQVLDDMRQEVGQVAPSVPSACPLQHSRLTEAYDIQAGVAFSTMLLPTPSVYHSLV